MIVECKLSKLDGVVQVHKEVTVRGEFHMDWLIKWRSQLQRSFEFGDKLIPDSPEYVTYKYEVSDDKFTKMEQTRGYRVEEVKGVIEGYYASKFNLNPSSMSREGKLPEMRLVVMVCCSLLTSRGYRELGLLYYNRKTPHDIVIYARKKVPGWYSTDPLFRQRMNDIAYELDAPELENKIRNL